MNNVDSAVAEQIALNAFYHATKGKLPVGSVVRHWGADNSIGGDAYVDSLRPSKVAPRWAHFFMTDKPKCLPELGRGPKQGYKLYEVEPVGDVVGPLNYGWLEDTSELLGVTPLDRVKNYWAGAASPASGSKCLNEWLAEDIRVNRYLGKLDDHLKQRADSAEVDLALLRKDLGV